MQNRFETVESLFFRGSKTKAEKIGRNELGTLVVLLLIETRISCFHMEMEGQSLSVGPQK